MYIIVCTICTSLCALCVHHCVHYVYIIVCTMCTSMCALCVHQCIIFLMHTTVNTLEFTVNRISRLNPGTYECIPYDNFLLSYFYANILSRSKLCLILSHCDITLLLSHCVSMFCSAYSIQSSLCSFFSLLPLQRITWSLMTHWWKSALNSFVTVSRINVS